MFANVWGANHNHLTSMLTRSLYFVIDYSTQYSTNLPYMHMSFLQLYGVGTRMASINFVKKSNRF